MIHTIGHRSQATVVETTRQTLLITVYKIEYQMTAFPWLAFLTCNWIHYRIIRIQNGTSEKKVFTPYYVRKHGASKQKSILGLVVDKWCPVYQRARYASISQSSIGLDFIWKWEWQQYVEVFS